MKKLVLIVVVAALALTLVPLAFAGAQGGGGWKHGQFKFNLVGKVAPAPAPAVDPTADPAVEPPADPPAVSAITIAVKAGSHIKGLRGKDITFTVADGAKVWQLTGDGAVAMTLGDVEVGDWVKVKGKIARDTKVYTITCIKYRDLTPAPVAEPETPPLTQ